MYFDPMYFLFLAPAMLLAAWAQIKVKTSFAHASRIIPASGLNGRETALRILEAEGIRNVNVEEVAGTLSDHYDPKAKVLRLSSDVYHGQSLAALGVAAHEVGHAIQDAQRYSPLVMRNAIVPLASFGSNASWFLMMAGFMIGATNLVLMGIFAFSLVVIFQLINLPVEFDASSRAKTILLQRGMISPSEKKEVDSVLGAAAMTYVAGTISSVLTLVYYLWRMGLLGQRRED
jgi:Zn-dependent membrane protease YugP